jgi:rhodanese-related sulfurtransferase
MTDIAVQRVTPNEAKGLLESSADVTYLDVRSDEEFRAGHVPDSVNIPLLQRGPSGTGLVPNPAFVAQVNERFSKDTRLITGCLRGGRSLKAAQLLVGDGFSAVIDMRGGYDGELSATGQLTCPGWARRGFPTTTD